jgi:hypothetical protein
MAASMKRATFAEGGVGVLGDLPSATAQDFNSLGLHILRPSAKRLRSVLGEPGA